MGHRDLAADVCSPVFPHYFQVVAIKSSENALHIGIGSRLVGFRLNSLVSQLTDMPILAIGDIPEIDRLRGVEPAAVNDILRK